MDYCQGTSNLQKDVQFRDDMTFWTFTPFTFICVK